jgi:hypothetical protein
MERRDDMTDGDTERLMSGRAWDDFCERLKKTGRRILEPDFPGSPRDRAEGFRHLTRMVVFGIHWTVEFADPDFPAFYRNDGDLVQWGAPNADNVYIRARIRGDGTYRITGNKGRLHEFVISTHDGDMHMEKYGVFEERTARDLEIAPDGSFEVILSPQAHPGSWMPLHPDVEYVLIRQYLSDWDHDEPGQFLIQKVGNEGLAPEPLEPGRMARMLDEAAERTERAVVYWNEFVARARANAPDNVVGLPRKAQGGAHSIFYGSAFYNLAEDEALLIECGRPDADYWSFQLNTLGWFESLDIANRQTSLSMHQAHIDDDGELRVVLAHRDPGVPNWLDTEGRREGTVSYRWVWARNTPTPISQVVKLDEVRRHFPASTPQIDTAARREQMFRRQMHVARRYAGVGH